MTVVKVEWLTRDLRRRLRRADRKLDRDLRRLLTPEAYEEFRAAEQEFMRRVINGDAEG